MAGLTYRMLVRGRYIVSNEAGCRSAAAAHYGTDLRAGEGPWYQGTPTRFPAVLHFKGQPGVPSNEPCVHWETVEQALRSLQDQIEIIKSF